MHSDGLILITLVETKIRNIPNLTLSNFTSNLGVIPVFLITYLVIVHDSAPLGRLVKIRKSVLASRKIINL
jgi:hypothetical protein